jgi:PKD repeat protein
MQTGTISHTFPFATAAQTYTVSLTVANACPSQQMVEKAITVQAGYAIYLPVVLK